ncbi:MAG TPA: hypothetical protein VMP68_06455 [Candidatus Eisenbacteria bacterium]|nr:hypothetical protein [Candidatus Eisenbacteria bacterium]
MIVRQARVRLHAWAIQSMQKKSILLIALMLLVSCSPRDYLSRRLATDLIASSAEFNQQQQVILKTGVVSNKDYVAPEFVVLQHHGWVTANSAKCPPGLEAAPCWDISLTPAGVDTIHLLVHAEEATKPAIPIPAARRELISVTGISKQGISADVEFTWRWIPVNEIGAAFYFEDQHYRSLVGFRQFDDGWRIVQSVPRSGQSIEEALKNAEPTP